MTEILWLLTNVDVGSNALKRVVRKPLGVIEIFIEYGDVSHV